MDFYRKRFGPDDGYEAHTSSGPPAARSTQSSPGGGGLYLVDYRSPQDSAGPHGGDRWGDGALGRELLGGKGGPRLPC